MCELYRRFSDSRGDSSDSKTGILRQKAHLKALSDEIFRAVGACTALPDAFQIGEESAELRGVCHVDGATGLRLEQTENGAGLHVFSVLFVRGQFEVFHEVFLGG